MLIKDQQDYGALLPTLTVPPWELATGYAPISRDLVVSGDGENDAHRGIVTQAGLLGRTDAQWISPGASGVGFRSPPNCGPRPTRLDRPNE